MRRPRISQQASIPRRIASLALFAVIAAATVLLACFALGVIQPPPQELSGQEDSNGTALTGTYDPASDSFLGTVEVDFETGAQYRGSFEDYRFNGYGVFVGEDVDNKDKAVQWRYEGTFVGGRLQGEGSYSDHLGRYEGNFENSLPQGQGTYHSLNGWEYTGEFRAGKMTGRGTVVLADGSTSSGTFEDGKQVSTR